MASLIDQIAGHACAPGMEPGFFDIAFGTGSGGGEQTALVLAGFVGLIILSRLLSVRARVHRGAVRHRRRSPCDPATARPRTRPGMVCILGRTLVDDPQIRARRFRDHDRAATG